MPEELSRDAKSWDIPYVEDPRKVSDTTTNALNRSRQWKYEPPEPEEEIIPPTAEEIEEIRKAAYEEGLLEGKHAGHQQGLEEGHKEGFEKGHQEGIEKGLEEGLAQGEEQIAQLSEQWQTLMTKLHQPVSGVEKQLEQELIQLAVSLARAVVRTETVTNENMIFQALSEGLKVLPIQESSYQLHMNPEDVALVKSHFSEDEIEKHNWHFVDTPGMSRGGCDITTQNNAVDVSVERRVREVLDKFLLDQGLHRGPE